MRALLVIVLCASSAARAQSPDKIQAQAAARDGQDRYEAGDFDLAAERFELAYQLDPDPAYLFNLAQSHRLGGKCAKAAAAYRKLLGVVSSGPNVAKVEQYIQQMDACVKSHATPPAPTKDPAEERWAPPPPPTTPRDDGNPALRYAGVGVTVAGALTLAYGVYATKKVRDYVSDREALCANGCQWSLVEAEATELDRQGRHYEKRMTIAYVAGGIAVVGGMAMMWFARGEPEIDRSVSFAPIEGGAMAFGTFAF